MFDAVCAAGNLTMAARQLHIAQSSISRTIRGLEDAVALPLFQRTGRGVVLTEAGTMLRAHTRGIFDELDKLDAGLAELRTDDAGEVHALLPRYVSDVLVPPFIRQFTGLFPRAELHVFEEPAASIPERLGAGTADLGIFYSSSSSVGLRPEPIASERIFLVGRPSDIGNRPGAISLSAVSSMELIVSSRHTPFRRFVEQRAAAAGCRLRVVRELEVSQSALAFVRDGEGLAILPLSHIHRDIAQGELVARPIGRPAIRRNILMSFGKRPSTALSRKTASLLKSVVASEGAVLGWLAAASEI